MTAWFLVLILTMSPDGQPTSALKIDNYKDQATCEAVKAKAVGQDWYPLLLCIERPVIEA